MDAVAEEGVTAMDARVAGTTVSLAVATVPAKVAVMSVAPMPTAVARPNTLTVAFEASPDPQVTRVVRSWVDWSLYVPVAVNCCVVPSAMLGVAGVTEIEDNVAALTSRIAVADGDDGQRDTLRHVAVIVAVPIPNPFAIPVPSTVATLALDELQVTWVEMFWVVRSERVAVAVNCASVPLAMATVAGVRAMLSTVAAVTESVVLPLCPTRLAVTVLEPGPTPSALPDVSTRATPASETVHAAVAVTSLCVSSL